MQHPFSISPPVSEALEDWCVVCGEPREVPWHMASPYQPPEMCHDFVSFRLSGTEVEERTETIYDVRRKAAVGGGGEFPMAAEYRAMRDSLEAKLEGAVDPVQLEFVMCNVMVECQGDPSLSPKGGPCAACAIAIAEDLVPTVDYVVPRMPAACNCDGCMVGAPVH